MLGRIIKQNKEAIRLFFFFPVNMGDAVMGNMNIVNSNVDSSLREETTKSNI